MAHGHAPRVAAAAVEDGVRERGAHDVGHHAHILAGCLEQGPLQRAQQRQGMQIQDADACVSEGRHGVGHHAHILAGRLRQRPLQRAQQRHRRREWRLACVCVRR